MVKTKYINKKDKSYMAYPFIICAIIGLLWKRNK